MKTKISTENLVNQDASGFLCNLILQSQAGAPADESDPVARRELRKLFLQKQQLIISTNAGKIKEFIIGIFSDFKKLVDMYTTVVPYKRYWLPVCQNINAMPQLVDISSALSLFGFKDYDKQVRSLYIGRYAGRATYAFFTIFSNEVGLSADVGSVIATSVIYDINKLARIALYFLYDLWICSLQDPHWIIKNANKYVKITSNI